jgi:hypothetical protein
MERLKKLLNTPPLPELLPLPLELDDELPNAEVPIFFEPDIKSIAEV